MRKWRSRRWAHGVLIAAVLLVPAHAGDAAASVESGWWTTSPVPIGPDVSEDQLLVQGGASEPAAYAGISFVLGPDEQPQRLRLTVAPDSASTPGSTLELCALSAPASAAAGEPAADGPTVDCEATSVEAAASSDGTTYEFDVTGFASGSSLDVGVLPTQSTDRVVLSSPGTDALAVTTEPAAGDLGPPPPSTSTADGVATGGSSTPSFDGGSSSASISVPPGSTLDLPAPDVGPAAPEADETAAPRPQPSAPAPLESVPAASTSDSGNGPAPFVVVGLMAVAAALWAFAGREPAVE